MRLVLALTCLVLGPSPTAAFLAPPGSSIRQDTVHFAVDKPDNKQRRPRFSQDAHSKATPKPKPRVVPRENPRASVNGDAAGGERRTPTPVSPSVQPQSRNDEFMWRTSKSIEDIEASMINRWGTEAGKWEADPNEYELEGDDDSDSTFSSGESVKFQGKPVLDPWQKEEIKSRKKAGEETPRKGVFGALDIEDATLRRVRKNQGKVVQKETRARKPAWADSVDEFYDEDDEGFETTGSIDSVGKLISPKPVGGSGTNARVSKGADNVQGESSESPGFFFNPSGAVTDKTDQPTSTVDETEVTNKPKPPRERATPVLREDGSQMYLTTEQAETNFRASMSEDSDDGTDDVAVKSTLWSELGITSKKLAMNLDKMGCEKPLSVQEKSCPSILTGTDVLVGTYTGSGKTLAFLAPLVQRLLFDDSSSTDGLQVLIVAPGRELASQIASVARELLEGIDMKVVLAIGGTTFSRNLEQIRKKKPTILVGTPGRIAELVVGQPGEKRGRMNIASLQTVVLDEFDALLEYKPHRDPTAAIMAALKRRHRDSLQSVLCSATASDMVGSQKLSNYLRSGHAIAMADKDDKLVTSADGATLSTRVSRTVMHGVVHVPRRQLALDTIRRILHTEPVAQQVLIFADNARRVDLVVEKLAEMDIVAAALHGGTNSDKMDRAEVSKALREGYVGIVVATELAARGLDAPLLTHVINLDLPTDASHYAHRAGRCGRGGRPGVVINITTDAKERNVPKRFAENLGIEMFSVEPRQNKLQVVQAESVVLDV